MTTYSTTDTVLLWTSNIEVEKILTDLMLDFNFKIYKANDVADIIAVPCFLRIVDAIHFNEYILFYGSEVDDFFKWDDSKFILCDKVSDTLMDLHKSIILRNGLTVFSKKTLTPFILRQKNLAIKDKKYRENQYNKRAFRMLFIYKLIQGYNEIDLGFLAFKFDKSERTINRDLTDLNRIFPEMAIGLKKDDYYSIRRTVSPFKMKNVLVEENNLRRNQFQIRIKTLVDFVTLFSAFQPIQVEINCIKYQISDRTLARYIKLIKEVYDHWNIKFNKEKGYYLV